MGLLDFLLDILSYDGKKDKNKKLEEEMELHGLDEEENPNFEKNIWQIKKNMI